MTVVGFKKHLQLLLGDLLTLTIALCIASVIPFIQTLKDIFPGTALIYLLCILTPTTVFISGYIVSRRYMMRFEHVQIIPEHIEERAKSGVKDITAAGLIKIESGIKKSCMHGNSAFYNPVHGRIKQIYTQIFASLYNLGDPGIFNVNYRPVNFQRRL